MQVFQDAADRAFVGRVVEHLRNHHAQDVRGLADDILGERARTGIARARQYGLSWERNLMAFVGLMFAIAPRFDEHEPIRRLLEDEAVVPNLRLDRVVRLTSEAVWREAQVGREAWWDSDRVDFEDVEPDRLDIR